MDIQPDLSVCVVGGVEEEALADFLQAVKAAADPLAVEAVVVTPRSLPALDRRFPEALFLETGRDEPPPKAGNRALRLARGRYLALFTAPALFPPEALLHLVNLLDDRPEVGLAGPRLQTPAGVTLPSAGLRPSALRLLAAAAAAMLGSRRPPLLSAPAFSREVDWLAGQGLVIRREVVEEVGFFAEEMALLWDLEFGLRARRAGWHAFFLREARVVCPCSQITPASPASLLADGGRLFCRQRPGRR